MRVEQFESQRAFLRFPPKHDVIFVIAAVSGGWGQILSEPQPCTTAHSHSAATKKPLTLRWTIDPAETPSTPVPSPLRQPHDRLPCARAEQCFSIQLPRVARAGLDSRTQRARLGKVAANAARGICRGPSNQQQCSFPAQHTLCHAASWWSEGSQLFPKHWLPSSPTLKRPKRHPVFSYKSLFWMLLLPCYCHS